MRVLRVSFSFVFGASILDAPLFVFVCMLMQEPITFNVPRKQVFKWTILSDLWKDNSITFSQEVDGWRIREVLEGTELFSLRRDYITNNRYTDTDLLGLLGVSLLNLNERSVFITEGVSDYFTAKLLLPKCNVLGVTQLGGSKNAKKMLISLFNEVTILADNDVAGLANANRWSLFLSEYGIKTNMWQSSIGKDITDEFIFNLRLGDTVQF